MFTYFSSPFSLSTLYLSNVHVPIDQASSPISDLFPMESPFFPVLGQTWTINSESLYYNKDPRSLGVTLLTLGLTVSIRRLEGDRLAGRRKRRGGSEEGGTRTYFKSRQNVATEPGHSTPSMLVKCLGYGIKMDLIDSNFQREGNLEGLYDLPKVTQRRNLVYTDSKAHSLNPTSQFARDSSHIYLVTCARVIGFGVCVNDNASELL